MKIIFYTSLALIGYLSGSIPFGYIVVKWKKNMDIRTVGSGNIGATNVYRILGIKWAVLVFIFDMLKGALPVILFHHFVTRSAILILSFTPFIGHCYTPWLGFKGGKGVATSAGILLVLAPYSLLTSLGIWIITVMLFHISSLGSLLAATALPLATFFLYDRDLFIFTLVLSIWVILRHKENIKRLLTGKEKTQRM